MRAQFLIIPMRAVNHTMVITYSQMTKSQVKTDSVLEPWQQAEHVKI